MWPTYPVDIPFRIRSFHSAFLLQADCGFFFPGEVHDFWEMMHCRRGCVTVTAGDQAYVLKENQTIFLHPLAFHSLRVETAATDLFVLSFDVEGRLDEPMAGTIWIPNEEQKSQLQQMICLLHADTTPFTEDTMISACLDSLARTSSGLARLASLVEGHCLSLMAGPPLPFPSGAQNDTEMAIYRRALTAISARPQERMTVSDLAQECHVGTTYIKRVFRKYSGLGVHEYILKSKISLAKQLLCRRVPITEVAERLGFSGQNYFSAAFKRETGMTPTAYRDENKKDI